MPKGVATVSEIYPKMKQFDLTTLLRLRADNSLSRMIRLQGEDAAEAARLVQLVQSPAHVTMMVSSCSSESPELIGVSASYDDEMPGRSVDDLTFSSREESPTASPKRSTEEVVPNRRKSVKELVAQIHSQNPAEKAAALKEMERRGSIPLHGLSFSEENTAADAPALRVQSGQFKGEVVGRLSEPQMDDDSRAESLDSSHGESSTLDDDAKLYQERLNNRNNNVLVKRDAASFRVKKDGARTTGSERPSVSKAAAARLHTMKARNTAHPKTADAAINSIYTYEQLKNRSIEELAANPYPEGVDVDNREQYLRDDEFFKVFGLTKADFNGIAKWRKTEMKKKKNLY